MIKPSVFFQSGDILFVPISQSIIFAFSMFSKKGFTVSSIPEYARKLDSTDIENLDGLSKELKECLLQKYRECALRYE